MYGVKRRNVKVFQSYIKHNLTYYNIKNMLLKFNKKGWHWLLSTVFNGWHWECHCLGSWLSNC